MIHIAHRGCIDGPDKKNENHPDFLLKAIKLGYFVELDLWFIDRKFILGHDAPQYETDLIYLHDIADKAFIHCKNIDALSIIVSNSKFECFYHEEDTCTLTSKGRIWTYPGILPLKENSIAVMPERCPGYVIPNNIYGVCSDFMP